MTADGTPGPRLLICAPGEVFGVGEIGGHQHVLGDLAEGLRGCGWQVDTLFGSRDLEASDPLAVFAKTDRQFRLGEAGRALGLPEAWRLRAGFLLRGRTGARHLSAILSGAQRRIESAEYSAVLVCLDAAPIGLAALTARIHPRSVITSLGALAFELRNSWSLRSVRAVAHLVAGRDLHPDLYSAVHPSGVHRAVFASRSWRDDAVASGLPAARAAVIHFGVAPGPWLEPPRRPAVPARLLWAARLSPEKGLHVFLSALAQVQREAAIRLTILAAPGPRPYRLRIQRLIDHLGVANLVEFRAAVSREDLPDLLGSHDVLLFHSVFREPVAQILLLAFAHGLVVVGPSSTDARSLLRDAETAFCFADNSPRAIAATILRAVRDVETRRTVREQAFTRVRSEHTVGHTIAAYDALLREVADLPSAGTPR